MQTQQKLFTNRMLLTLLWPLVVEQALNVLVGMSDTVMVSSVGEAAISGVSLVDMINYLILNIFAALATGGAETDIAMGRVPFDGAYEDAVIDGMQVLQPNLERNRTLIRRFLE